MSLEFLHADADGAPPARSPIADAANARTEVRAGWEVAVSFGDPEAEARACAEAVGVADLSHLGKLEVHGEAGELGTAIRRDDHWWCPITPERSLVLCAPDAAPRLRDQLDALDLTTSYGALAIVGPLARETFARFCALDLREHVMPVNAFRPASVARTPGFVLRDGAERFLMLFGAAYGQYVWEVVTDAATHLGGGPVGLDVIEQEPARA